MPFQLAVSLTEKQIRHTNPVNQIADIIAQVPGLKSHRDIVNTVLSELYNNALEHGILQLESRNKLDDEGFLQYYDAKEKALTELEHGNIRINIGYSPRLPRGGELMIRISDSGNGFDYQQITSSVDAPYGRGLMLVASLCEELKFEDNGATVEAVYVTQ